MTSRLISKCGDDKPWLMRLEPAWDWLAHDERNQQPGDAFAGWVNRRCLTEC
jgi:hypothetical protein